jgi:hypothetical protein
MAERAVPREPGRAHLLSKEGVDRIHDILELVRREFRINGKGEHLLRELFRDREIAFLVPESLVTFLKM